MFLPQDLNLDFKAFIEMTKELTMENNVFLILPLSLVWFVTKEGIKRRAECLEY